MNNQSYVQRDIKRVWKVKFQNQSPTHKVGLVLEPGNWEEFDPFLIMAEDWFQKGDFGLHPHRGMETVTYVIEGKLEHFDNKNGRGELHSGDVQWMTAGRGVMHIEEPPAGETVHTLQLWVNLPRENKMTEPRYQNLRSQDMPVRKGDGAVIRVFSGSSGEVKSNTLNHAPITMVEIQLEPGKAISQDLPGTYNGFIYVLEGEGVFGIKETVGVQGQVLLLGSVQEGSFSEIMIQAKSRLRVLLYAGQPIREKVVARGPFVMNSDEEILQAYRDYQNGEFGK